MKLKNVVIGSEIEAKHDTKFFTEGEVVKVLYKEDSDCEDSSTLKLENSKGEILWSNHEYFRRPRLKKLDQSVFNGLDDKWRFAAVDRGGLLKAFTYKPKLSVSMTSFILLIGNTIDIGTGYDSSNWQNSLIERESKELTGEALVMAMLKNGKDKVLVRVSSSVDTPLDSMIPTFAKKDGDKVVTNNGNSWEKVIAIDIDGNPLTAKDVGL